MDDPLCTPASGVVRRGPQGEEEGDEPGWVGRRPGRGSPVERQETGRETGKVRLLCLMGGVGDR